MTKLAVIIPYFQREPGLLRACLESVAAQARPAGLSVSVHVVDDGSPAPLAAELAGLAMPEGVEVRGQSTANSGAPAARNRALDAVAADADYVAFLDSDDVWTSDHLARATGALDQGFDVYFSDHTRHDMASYFQAVGAEPLLVGPPIGGDASLADLSQADVFGLLLRHYLAQSSTVVFRRAIAADLRFDESLRTAGEDHLFWLGLARASPRFCASRQVEAVCGQGVSIYYSSFNWDAAGNIHRVSCLARLYERIEHAFALSPADADHVRSKIDGLKSALAFFLARTVLKTGRPPKDLGAIRRQHPHFWSLIARHLTLVVRDMCLGRYRLMEK